MHQRTVLMFWILLKRLYFFFFYTLLALVDPKHSRVEHVSVVSPSRQTCMSIFGVVLELFIIIFLRGGGWHDAWRLIAISKFSPGGAFNQQTNSGLLSETLGCDSPLHPNQNHVFPSFCQFVWDCFQLFYIQGTPNPWCQRVTRVSRLVAESADEMMVPCELKLAGKIYNALWCQPSFSTSSLRDVVVAQHQLTAFKRAVVPCTVPKCHFQKCVLQASKQRKKKMFFFLGQGKDTRILSFLYSVQQHASQWDTKLN